MSDKKIIFMGTPDIAAQHLNSLIENNLNIISIFTQPPRKKNRGSEGHQAPGAAPLEFFSPQKHAARTLYTH